MVKNYFSEIFNFNNLVKQKIEIVNVEESKYNICIKDLSQKFLINNYYGLPEVKSKFNISLCDIAKIYKNMGVNVIKTPKGHYFFRKEQVDNYIEYLKTLIPVKEAIRIYEKEFGKKTNSTTYDRKFNVIRDIPFFIKTTFIKKDEYEKFIKDKIKIKNKDSISVNDFNNLLSEKFYGYKVYKKNVYTPSIKKLCDKLDLEYYEPFSEKNDTKLLLIPKKTKDFLLKYLTNKLIIIIKGDSNYYIERSYITKEILLNDYYEWEELKRIFAKSGIHIKGIKSTNVLNGFKVNIIRFLQPINKTYFRKEEVEYWLDINEKYTKANLVKLNIEESIRIKIDMEFNPRFLNYRNVKYKIDPKFMGRGLFILNDDIHRLKESIIYDYNLKEAKTSYQKFQIKKKTLKIFNNNIPKTLELFEQYCLIKSGNSHSRNTSTIANTYLEVYKILCSRLTKELEYLGNDELKMTVKEIVKIASKTSGKTEKEILLFFKYLKKNGVLKDIPFFIRNKQENISINSYDIMSFMEVLLILLNILTDSKSIKKLVRKRVLSSTLLYVYLHFSLAWRRRDLLEKLPLPNLSLINFDADSFLSWIENENGVFTEEMGKIICCNIEEQVSRNRLKTYKTNKELVCIIPEFMYSTLGLLFCLCEANRVYEHNQNRRNYKTTTLISTVSAEATKIYEVFDKICKVNINEILGGNFSNVRGVKSFLTNISEKSEEFKLGAGYYYAQILRSHSNYEGLVSEVTKIYVDKDTSKTSVNAFLTGTMGCVKYNILSLIDNKFEESSFKEMESKVLALNMTPYEIEYTMKIVGEKCSKIKKFLNERLTTRVEKDMFLKELLYGKKSYAKHQNTKCLLRIVNVATGVVRKIGITENKECIYNTGSCIGCEYFVALKYFIYEFVDRFNLILDDLERADTEIDIKISLDRINKLYFPIIGEMQLEIGKEQVEELLNIDRLKEIILAKNFEIVKLD